MKLIVVPWLFGKAAITLAPYVIIMKKYKDDPRILAHEQVHLDQVAHYGWWTFYWRYITNLSFRKQMEDEGYAAQYRSN